MADFTQKNFAMSIKNVTPIGGATPELLLRRLADEEDQINCLLVAVQNKDGIAEVYSTKMKNSDLTWLAWNIQNELSHIVNDD